MISRRWTPRLALIALFAVVAIVTGCSPTPLPASTASTTKARTPLVVIPASAKTYSNRGVVAWKVYPYLSGTTGGFTLVGVDTKSNVKRVTRVFDVPGKVAGAPPTLVYSPLYPNANGRTLLGHTGLVWQASMSSATNARHINDVMSDATSYLPSASSQGEGCSNSIKHVVACLTAPSVGDLGSRWTQVRACRIAMSHLVKPQTCIQHSLTLKVPSGSTAAVKDGDDDDTAPAGDDDDTNNANNTDTSQQNAPDTSQQNTPQADAQQDAQQDNDDSAANQPAPAGDFSAGTGDNTTPTDNTPTAGAADTQPTDANGLAPTEATTAAGADPIPAAGQTPTAATDQAAADPLKGTGLPGDCEGSTDSTQAGIHAASLHFASCASTPATTADQGAFGAASGQASCTTGCAATSPTATTASTGAPITALPTTQIGATAQASVALGGLTANVSVTTIPSDPGYAYIGVGGGLTTQVAGAGVAAGPIAVRSTDPTGTLTGSSVVSDTGGSVGIGGVNVEVATNKTGTTYAVTPTVGPSMVPITVTAGMSYGWRVKLPDPAPDVACGYYCD